MVNSLLLEIQKQISLGHERFCIGAHVHENGELEYEWEDWSTTATRLAEQLVASETKLEKYQNLPISDWATDGPPVVLIPFSQYQLINMAAACESIAGENWWNTGDWMICIRDRIPQAAKQYVSKHMCSNVHSQEMKENRLKEQSNTTKSTTKMHIDGGDRYAVSHYKKLENGEREFLPQCIRCRNCWKWIRPEDFNTECFGRDNKEALL